MYCRDIDTPWGILSLTEVEGALSQVRWERTGRFDQTELLQKAEVQLAAYAAGTLDAFDLALHVPDGLQGAVCTAMRAIPMGETRTYGDIARDVGASAQAVGQACGRNPLPILIPCHRVMGASGLTGFSAPGGVEMKVTLLRHEGASTAMGGFLI
ncbi:MAG: methylated-DNA--[protein]-cysteine S-methyltransferase [Pseudomonadota bacterium]